MKSVSVAWSTPLMRQAAGWALCAILLSVPLGTSGAPAAALATPFMRSVIEILIPAIAVDRLEVTRLDGQMTLVCWTHLKHILTIGRRTIYEPVMIRSKITVGAIWQPVAIAIATAVSWPLTLSARAFATFVAAVLSSAVAVVLTPLHLAAMIFGSFYFARASDQPKSVFVSLPMALESGLRIAIGFLCGFLAVWIAARVFRNRELGRTKIVQTSHSDKRAGAVRVSKAGT